MLDERGRVEREWIAILGQALLGSIECELLDYDFKEQLKLSATSLECRKAGPCLTTKKMEYP
jgi:hypothetical protein